MNLVVAHRGSSGWARDSIVTDSLTWFTPYPLAIDAAGRPHVLLVGAGGQGLVHAVRTDAGWVTTTIDPAWIGITPGLAEWPYPPQLALAPDGTPHVLYQAGNVIWHAAQTANGWVRDSLPIAAGQNPTELALAIGASGAPRVAFLGAPAWAGDPARLVYAYPADGTWVPATLSWIAWQGGLAPEIRHVLDANDLPSILFSGPALGQLSLATQSQTADVAPAAAARGLALALPSPGVLAPGRPARWVVSLPAAGAVTLEAFDVAGRRVATSGAYALAAGTSTLAWSPGAGAPGGMFVRANMAGQHSAAVHVVVRR